MKIEICANSVASVWNAENGKADRVELCEHLSVGGLTPDRYTIMAVVNTSLIPLHVLIRPRAGDFNYSKEELEQMHDDIRYCKSEGCEGVVIGVLTREMEIDVDALSALMKTAAGMHITFHRAFDEVIDPEHALDQLIELGVDGVLTSGQQATAIEGLPLLKTLLARAKGRIEIMPGAGIGSSNALLFKEAGFPSIHLSATLGIPDGTSNLEEIKKVVSLVS